MQPRLYLQYHQWSRKAESINVTHYVVTYQDVLAHLQKESYQFIDEISTDTSKSLCDWRAFGFFILLNESAIQLASV